MTSTFYLEQEYPNLSADAYKAMASTDLEHPDLPGDDICRSEGFGDFLINVNGKKRKKPHRNAKRVMRAAARVQDGLGLHYPKSRSPDPNDQFKDNRYGKHLGFKNMDEFRQHNWDEAYDQVHQFHSAYADDTSHGWNFTHPLKKMLLFSRFLENRVRQHDGNPVDEQMEQETEDQYNDMDFDDSDSDDSSE